MSDPVSHSEIEDVLSSIRRLVSEEARVAPRPVGPAPALILTPDARVRDVAEPVSDEASDSDPAPVEATPDADPQAAPTTQNAWDEAALDQAFDTEVASNSSEISSEAAPAEDAQFAQVEDAGLLVEDDDATVPPFTSDRSDAQVDAATDQELSDQSTDAEAEWGPWAADAQAQELTTPEDEGQADAASAPDEAADHTDVDAPVFVHDTDSRSTLERAIADLENAVANSRADWEPDQDETQSQHDNAPKVQDGPALSAEVLAPETLEEAATDVAAEAALQALSEEIEAHWKAAPPPRLQEAQAAAVNEEVDAHAEGVTEAEVEVGAEDIPEATQTLVEDSAVADDAGADDALALGAGHAVTESQPEFEGEVDDDAPLAFRRAETSDNAMLDEVEPADLTNAASDDMTFAEPSLNEEDAAEAAEGFAESAEELEANSSASFASDANEDLDPVDETPDTLMDAEVDTSANEESDDALWEPAPEAQTTWEPLTDDAKAEDMMAEDAAPEHLEDTLDDVDAEVLGELAAQGVIELGSSDAVDPETQSEDQHEHEVEAADTTAPVTEAPEAVDQGDDLHAAVLVPAPSREPAAQQDNDAGVAAKEDLLSEEIDEDALRELVVSIVRQELQGPLGERITRNVRKLVRREISRVMESGPID